MIFRAWLIIFILPLFIQGCIRPSQNDFSGEKEAILKEVRSMLEDYHLAIEKNGLMAEFDYLDPSEEFFWVPPGHTSALSYDSVHALIAENAGRYASVKFKWDTLRLTLLAPNAAGFTGIVSGYMTDTSGSTTAVAIIETGAVIKRTDGWKLLHGQSAIQPKTDIR